MLPNLLNYIIYSMLLNLKYELPLGITKLERWNNKMMDKFELPLTLFR